MALPWTTGQNPWATGGGSLPKPVTGAQPSPFGNPAPAAPAQPNYSGMSQAASAAGNYNATTHAMTPAQRQQHDQLQAMTPEQRAQYTTGQSAAGVNAGKAATEAGNYNASQVSPGGPQSVGVVAEADRQKAADAAGLDFMKPGINERFMQANGSNLLTGGPTDAFWKGAGTDLMGGSNSQKVFDEAQANRPQLPGANMDAYYDRAEQNATTKLSAAQAARGAYGSSVGVGQVGSMLADLGAQRAKDEADYGLRRSDLERNWMTARGDLAGAADRDQVSRWTATGSGAATADDQTLKRWSTTQQAAESAQGSQRQRGQDLFNNNLSMGDKLSGTVKDSFETGVVQDQGMVDAIINLGLAKDAAGVADLLRRANEDQAVAKQLTQAFYAWQMSQDAKGDKK